MKFSIVIDVFRACTTACYVLEQNPTSYKLAVKQAVVERLAADHINPLIIGKSERGLDGRIYHIPNSPTRVRDVEIANRDVIHRTEAGAKGVLMSQDADIILLAGFVNASATVNFLKTFSEPEVTILPMGHEGKTPSLEDDICAKYIQTLIDGTTMDPTPYFAELRLGAGQYFFSEDQWQYPSEDFDRCLEIDHYDFAIKAVVSDEYSTLTRCNKIS